MTPVNVGDRYSLDITKYFVDCNYNKNSETYQILLGPVSAAVGTSMFDDTIFVGKNTYHAIKDRKKAKEKSEDRAELYEKHPRYKFCEPLNFQIIGIFLAFESSANGTLAETIMHTKTIIPFSNYTRCVVTLCRESIEEELVLDLAILLKYFDKI